MGPIGGNASGKRSSRAAGAYVKRFPLRVIRAYNRGVKDDLLTPVRAAAYLEVDVSTLRRWATEGRIERVFISDRPFYRVSDLKRLQRPRIGRPRS
jgi:hypothetical protein